MADNATATETAVVTKAELLEIAAWERKYADAKTKVSAAEKELDFRRQALAEKVLGVKSKDELKELSPDQIDRRFEKRRESGAWRAERGSPEFSFVKSSSGRYPAWRSLYIGELGETAAARISAETPVIYSYRVEVSLP